MAPDDEVEQAPGTEAEAQETEHIHYGEAQRVEKSDVAAAVARGNITLLDDAAETLTLPQASIDAQRRQEELLAKVEERRKMRETVVPTDDKEVRSMLRALDEPITRFGEREMERRARLRKILAHLDDDQADRLLASDQITPLDERVPEKEVFYTEGDQELRHVRIEYARMSLHRAAHRLLGVKRRREDPDEDEEEEMQTSLSLAARIVNMSSEIGDERPVAACAFSPDGTQLAAGAWSGTVKLWTVPNCQTAVTIPAHDSRVTGVAWHPMAGQDESENAVMLATGSADTSARLWSASGTRLRILAGHSARLARVAFHPFGRHLATASYDMTWRLWDVETGNCILEQEGHSRPVYAVAFQCDGSLGVSAGLDAYARVWDLRTGRCVMTLEGHVKGILAADWSPNGHVLATGGIDHTARVWDIRSRRKPLLFTIPAHKHLISQVRFEPNDGHYLLTCGYDDEAKLWSAHDFRPLKVLSGHEGKIMHADICPDGSGLIATVSYDRTIKFWAPDTLQHDPMLE